MRIAFVLAALLIGTAQMVYADLPDTLNQRVGKLEKEMHAVQRKVFPSGAPVEPDLTAASSTTSNSGVSTPIADLTQRVDLLEAQVKTLTGQSEQHNIHLKRIEDALKAQDARIKALEPVAAVDSPASTTTTKPVAVKPVALKPASGVKSKAVTGTPTPTSSAVDPTREARVKAIAVPDTGDAVEDGYAYGYRLYEAKLYPEAQKSLTDFVTKYPKSKRYSYAQNLLGRAYFDEGKYASAAHAFVENYSKMPRGERASESLSWAGVSLTKDGFPTKACRVYQEFSDVYGTTAGKDSLARVAKGRIDAKCTG